MNIDTIVDYKDAYNAELFAWKLKQHKNVVDGKFIIIDGYVFFDQNYDDCYQAVRLQNEKIWLRNYGPDAPWRSDKYPQPKARQIDTIADNEIFTDEFLSKYKFYDEHLWIVCKCLTNSWAIESFSYGVTGTCANCGNRVYWGE
jgi:hypothetical protein